MNSLTQCIDKLALYANFDHVCALPSNKSIIEQLICNIKDKDAEFFTDNEAFSIFYDDPYWEHSDFDCMVDMLRNMYRERLDDDAGGSCEHVLEKYGVPDLPKETYWGATLYFVLDTISDSTHISVTMQFNNPVDAAAYTGQLRDRTLSYGEISSVQNGYSQPLRFADPTEIKNSGVNSKSQSEKSKSMEVTL